MKVKPLRLKAVLPLSFVVMTIVTSWLLLADSIARLSVEAIGSRLVGAKVEVGEVDLSFSNGNVRLTTLLVTDPRNPMKNIFQADEIIADLDMMALLEKKVVIDTMAVRGLRFGTARTTSGALAEEADGVPGLFSRQIDSWASSIRTPELSFSGMQGNFALDLHPDSLGSVVRIREIRNTVDSVRSDFDNAVTSVNIIPVLNSGRALLETLQGKSITSLGLTGAPRAISQLRSTIEGIDAAQGSISQLSSLAGNGTSLVSRAMNGLDEIKREDYNRALDQLRLPSIDTPDLSPGIFSSAVVEQIQPVLYWTRLLSSYMPPGLDPRRDRGPNRLRLAGSDIYFPILNSFPQFLVAFAEVSLHIDDQDELSGDYLARITGFTNEPSVHGAPATIFLERNNQASRLGRLSVAVVFDHTSPIPFDSVSITIEGIALPKIDISSLGTELDLGKGNTVAAFSIRHDSILGGLTWVGGSVAWEPTASATDGLGTHVNLFNSMSHLKSIHVAVSLKGAVSNPELAISSNFGRQIVASLRQQLGSELGRAELRVRGKVDQLLQEQLQRLTSESEALGPYMTSIIGDREASLAGLKTELEERVRQLTPRLPGLRRP